MVDVTTLAWTIPALPLLAALLVTFLGKAFPQRGAPVALVGVGGSLLLALWLLWDVVSAGHGGESSVAWIRLRGVDIGMGVLVDNLSAWLAAIVAFLSFLIVLYSWHYFAEEGNGRRRYYAEVSLFIGGMLGTVLANNFLTMFIFWEIMGLCSYLLIGYWFTRESAAKAALKAFLVTRIGDVMLLVGIVILFVKYGTFNYRELFAAVDATFTQADGPILTFASLMIFGGAVGKSAQFPLHVWLPDAMEGPTTVSALIHAATMVKAGVFLVARSFPLILHTPDVFVWIGVIGGFTAFFTATMALVMHDIKRVLAYSTLSQLGYMFLALGAGGLLLVQGVVQGYVAGLFHLMNHAFFKALLFLAAGSVGHAFHHAANPYDMRQMGGLHSRMKLTSVTMLIATIAIAGIPPFSGFWSKDEVLAATFNAGASNGLLTLMWTLGIATAFMTAFYMFRLWFNVFAGKPRSAEAEHAHESPRTMTFPLAVLAVFALGSGFFILAGLEPFLAHVVSDEVHAFHASEFLVHLLTSWMTWLSVAVAASGIWLAYLMYIKGNPDPARVAARFRPLANAATRRWYMDDLWNGLACFFGPGLAYVAAFLDRWVIDGIVNGLGSLTNAFAGRLRKWQTGYVSTYATTVTVGLFGLIFVLLMWDQVWDFLGGLWASVAGGGD